MRQRARALALASCCVTSLAGAASDLCPLNSTVFDSRGGVLAGSISIGGEDAQAPLVPMVCTIEVRTNASLFEVATVSLNWVLLNETCGAAAVRSQPQTLILYDDLYYDRYAEVCWLEPSVPADAPNATSSSSSASFTPTATRSKFSRRRRQLLDGASRRLQAQQPRVFVSANGFLMHLSISDVSAAVGLSLSWSIAANASAAPGTGSPSPTPTGTDVGGSPGGSVYFTPSPGGWGPSSSNGTSSGSASASPSPSATDQSSSPSGSGSPSWLPNPTGSTGPSITGTRGPGSPLVSTQTTALVSLRSPDWYGAAPDFDALQADLAGLLAVDAYRFLGFSWSQSRVGWNSLVGVVTFQVIAAAGDPVPSLTPSAPSSQVPAPLGSETPSTSDTQARSASSDHYLPWWISPSPTALAEAGTVDEEEGEEAETVDEEEGKETEEEAGYDDGEEENGKGSSTGGFDPHPEDGDTYTDAETAPQEEWEEEGEEDSDDTDEVEEDEGEWRRLAAATRLPPRKHIPGSPRSHPAAPTPPHPGKPALPRALQAPSPAADTGALLRALFAALLSPSQAQAAALRATSVLRFADPQSVLVQWTEPAGISMTPSNVIISVPFASLGRQGAACAPLSFSNPGDASLIITSVSFTPLDSPYGAVLEPATSLGDNSLTIESGAAPVTVSVCIDTLSLPRGSMEPATFVMEVAHNVPAGPHAGGLEVLIVGAPSPAPPALPSDDSITGILSSFAFKAGVGTAFGSLLAMVLCGLCVWVRYCRKRGGGAYGSGASGAGGKTKLGVFRPGSVGDQAAARPPVPVSPDSDGEEREQGGRGGVVALGDRNRPREQSGKPGAAGARAAGAAPAAAAELSHPGRVHAPPGGGVSGAAAVARSLAAGAGLMGPHRPGAFEITLSDSEDEEEEVRRKGERAALSGVKRAPPKARTAGASDRRGSSGAPYTDGGIPYTDATPPADALSSSSSRRLALRSKPVLKASEFEAKWAALATVELWGGKLRSAPTAGEIEKALAPAGIVCLASGTVGGVSKFYFFAQEEAEPGRLCMAELSVTLASLRLSAVAKAAERGMGTGFVDVLKGALQPLLQNETA